MNAGDNPLYRSSNADSPTLVPGRANRRRSSLADDAPEAFICPISLRIMTDPVLTRHGHTFERSTIKEWLGKHASCPITRARLSLKDVYPNRALQDEINRWQEQRRAQSDPGVASMPASDYITWEPKLPDLNDATVQTVLRLYDSDAEGKKAALFGLLSLAELDTEESRYELAHAGVIPPMLEILILGDSEDKATAAVIFDFLTRSCNPVIVQSCSSGIPWLISLLEKGNEQARPALCGALMNLAASTDANKLAIATAGCIPHLVSCLDPENASAEETKLTVADCLSHLAFRELTRLEIADSGAIPWLVLMAAEKPSAMVALASLAGDSEGVAWSLLLSGALGCFVNYVNNPTTEIAEEAAAGKAILKMASFDQLRYQICNRHPLVFSTIRRSGLLKFIMDTTGIKLPEPLLDLLETGRLAEQPPVQAAQQADLPVRERAAQQALLPAQVQAASQAPPEDRRMAVRRFRIV